MNNMDASDITGCTVICTGVTANNVIILDSCRDSSIEGCSVLEPNSVGVSLNSGFTVIGAGNSLKNNRVRNPVVHAFQITDQNDAIVEGSHTTLRAISE